MDKVAYEHYEGLRRFLSSYLQSQRSQNTPSNQRASAREKLTRLTKPQFTDMSTDVYDEMKRRQTNSLEVPFLPVRDDFHPKRNQARQKLATLPSSRFKDLSSDVYFEIERRFPVVVQQYISDFGDDGTLQAGAVSPVNNTNNNNYQRGMDSKQQTRYSPVPPDTNRDNKSDRYQSSTASSQGQQGSKASAGLDQLMANLGDMMNSPGAPSPNVINNNSNSNNELLIKINELQSESNADKQEIQELKQKISLQAQETKDMDALLDKMTRDYKKLKEEFDNLQDDYNSQQIIASDIRTEAANLLNEIKALSNKNEELIEENKRLKAGNAGNYRRDDYNDTPNNNNNNDGYESQVVVLEQERIDSFYSAIDNLVLSGRGDTPTNVLVSMKSVVIASKQITEDTEHYESTTSSNLPYEDREDIVTCKNKLSSCLGLLMNAAKQHATNGGGYNSIDALEDAAGDLSAVIEELIQVLRNCERNRRDIKSGSREYGGKNRESVDVQELKNFLEMKTDEIVQAIQNLLYAMRTSTTYGSEFQSNVSGITTVVDNLISLTKKTFSSPAVSSEMKSQGDLILSDLKNANYTLEDIGNSMLDMVNDDPNSKVLKQKLASSSYEIAKFVKELISLLE